ncbi:hypothetical protein PMIT1318_00324 [Prochlorococcus marinus str. MIT 1318]|nr:hypothetical protein PMIT1318_00324 [Prochlorococcus marinus str. MIT 1318]
MDTTMDDQIHMEISEAITVLLATETPVQTASIRTDLLPVATVIRDALLCRSASTADAFNSRGA